MPNKKTEKTSPSAMDNIAELTTHLNKTQALLAKAYQKNLNSLYKQACTQAKKKAQLTKQKLATAKEKYQQVKQAYKTGKTKTQKAKTYQSTSNSRYQYIMVYQQTKQASLLLVEQHANLLQSYKLWQAEQKVVEKFHVSWDKKLAKQAKIKTTTDRKTCKIGQG